MRGFITSRSIIRTIKSRMRWEEHVAQVGNRNACRLLVVKPEGKTPLGRPRRVWLNNIKMDRTLDGVVLTRLIWLRIGTSGELF
jgi:hypothetical protein